MKQGGEQSAKREIGRSGGPRLGIRKQWIGLLRRLDHGFCSRMITTHMSYPILMMHTQAKISTVFGADKQILVVVTDLLEWRCPRIHFRQRSSR